MINLITKDEKTTKESFPPGDYQLLWFFAHEIGHFWNSNLAHYNNPDDEDDIGGWIWEGASELFSWQPV